MAIGVVERRMEVRMRQAIGVLVAGLLAVQAEAREPIERLLVEVPDPGAAAQLSAFPGFGAGHFYAQQPERGAVFAGTQAVGLLMMAGSYAWSVERPQRWANNGGPAIGTAGATIFLTSRIVDQVLAPYSAHRTGRKLAE